MFLWIIKQIIMSLIIITLFHYLYIFFKKNLTVPKIKDLVNRPEQKYKEIYQSLEKPPPPPKQSVDMKSELKNYLKGLGKDMSAVIPSSNSDPFNNNFETL